MKTFIIGDVHGNCDALQRLLYFINYQDAEDRLIFLGDVIDRGPDSRRVMDLLLELDHQQRHVFIKGNHEDMVIDCADGKDQLYIWLEDGQGRKCLQSYNIPDNYLEKIGSAYYYRVRNEKRRVISEMLITEPEQMRQFLKMVFPEDHLLLMRSMPASYESGDFFFSHAGTAIGRPLHLGDNDHICIWGDNDFIKNDETDYGKIMVFGHWHLNQPYIGFKKIGLGLTDNRVAALDLQDMIIIDNEGSTYDVPASLLMRGASHGCPPKIGE